MPAPTDALPIRSAPRSPLVSVIIPIFNAAAFIGTCLQSVFAQEFADYEVILINDGSHDTEALEKAILPYASRIIYLTQENGGPSAARNRGIAQACGEWLAFLDSDDTWFPQYLAAQVAFLRQDPSLDMVYCDAVLEDETGQTDKSFMQLYPSIGPVTFESLLLERTQVITSSTVVRRQRVVSAGLFDITIRYSEDHDLWLRISHAGAKIGYHTAVLQRRRVRSGSQGSSIANLLGGEIQSLTKLSGHLDLNPRLRALLADRLRLIQAEMALLQGKKFLLAGHAQKAYDSLRRAHALAPSSRLSAALLGLRVAPRLTVLLSRYLLEQRTRAAGTHS